MQKYLTTIKSYKKLVINEFSVFNEVFDKKNKNIWKTYQTLKENYLNYWGNVFHLNSKRNTDLHCKKVINVEDNNLNKALSFLNFWLQIEIFNKKKDLINLKNLSEKDNEEKKAKEFKEFLKLKHEIIKLTEIFREISYYYFNSIRLKNSFAISKNEPILLGFVIIKDPEENCQEKELNFNL